MKDFGARIERLLMVAFLLAWFGSGAGEAYGASGLTFTAGTTNGLPGTQVVVPIRASGFNNINTAQFSVHWSPSIVSFVGIEQVGLGGLAGGNFGTNNADNGTLTLSWDDPNAASQSVADGTAIFTIRFQLVGALGSVSGFSIDGTPTGVEVADGDLQVLPVSLVSGQIGITQPNSPPVLAAIANKAVTEGSPLTFTALGSDSDTPAQTLTYSLDAGAPAGASIDAASGVFTWTPTEAQGPSTNAVTVRVTDSGFQHLSASQTFTITVNEFNSAPVLATIGNKTVNEGIPLSFTVSASDSDVPAQTLTYSLGVGAPVGASINSSNGLFTWTPTEAQGPGSYSVTFRATDSGSPALTASQTISISVNEVNSAPTLASITNKTVNEGSLLSFTASATDSDIPPQTLTYSLDAGAPTGASINPANGVFTWTPTEAQGPNTYSVTIRVTDNGSPALSAAQTFTITVNEINFAPVLAAIGNKTVNEGSPLSFTVTATDANLPAQTLTYSLDPGAPAGASIGASSGLFTWTPTEAQGPSTNRVTFRVTDSGSPSMSATQAITITVNEVNNSPVLASIGNKTVNEGVLLSFTASATDSDLPAQTLTYSLDAGAPPGASINPSTGVFTWTPTEAQGPGAYPVTIRVTDSGSPSASAAQTITVTVNEVNSAPALAAIGDKHIAEGSLSSFTVIATDSDIPAQTLTFSLGVGAPDGASIDPASGVFTWTPTLAQGSTTNLITFRVTDNGSPPLGDSQTIVIAVGGPNAAPVFTPIGNKSVTEGSPLSFTVSAADADLPAQTVTYSLDAGAPAGAAINATNGLFTWTPTAAQGPSTNLVTFRATDNGSPSASGTATISIIVNEINTAPVLAAITSKIVNEGSPLTFTASGTDADVPAQTLAYTLDAGAPIGASIDPVTGIFNWTPTEAQGPSTVTFGVRVTDSGIPPLSAVQSVTVTVKEVNSAPVLAAIGNKTVDEGSPLSFTVLATDPDIPAQILTYSLDAGAPLGASLNPATGLFTWMPTEAQGPSTNQVTVRVTDNGSPVLSASQTFTIVVNEVNNAPVMTAIANKTVNEGTLLTFTVVATDSDTPAQTLTYSLDPGAPAGASINPATGAFTWTPTEAQGPSTNAVTIRVTDNGAPPASSTQTITITVNEVNAAPVLAAIGNKTIDEGSLLTFTASATDADLPAQTLTYSVDAGAPAGASINPATGVFTWTPTEAQGPSTAMVTVRVTDNGSPAMSAFQTITITVREVNTAPVLGAISDKNINEGSLLTFTASATDADLPAQTLVYSLDPGAPAGATINPSTGVFSWTPTEAQGPGTNTVTIRVTDNGSPSADAAQTFTIIVNEVNLAPVLAAIGNKSIGVGNLLSFTASATDADLPAQQLTYSLDAGAPEGAAIDPATGLFTWTPTETQAGSVVVTVRVTDNGTPALSAFRNVSIAATQGKTTPQLPALGNKSVEKGTLLTFSVAAVNANLFPQPLTYSLDPGAPTGANLDPATGLFAWAPAGAQGSSTNVVTFRVSDNGAPASTAAETITIFVKESEVVPVLAPIGNKTVSEGGLLTFTASPASASLLPQTLVYSLDAGAPTGAKIDSTTGVFTWRPTEVQAPSIVMVTIRATDNGSPPLSAFQNVTITVTEVNSAPILGPIENQTVNEGTRLSFTATATDADTPAQRLTFSLAAGAPVGASIDPATGLFSWTPTEAQGPSTNQVTIRVTDNGSPFLTDSRTITITVNEVNAAPVLALIGDKSINEGSLLTFRASATDPDVPAQTITYSLDAGAPAGASIDPASGIFTWTPTEAQGPMSYPATVRATDNGTPALSAAQTFIITVNEVNTAPVLTPIANQTVTEGNLLTFHVTATDGDLPPQVLAYSLGPGAPLGASLDPVSGVFTWTPNEIQGPRSYALTVRVTDNGSPALSASQIVTITVSEVNNPPTLMPIGNQMVNEGGVVNFKASASDSDLPAQVLTYSLDAGAPAGASINPVTGAFTWKPTEAQGPSTNILTVRVTDNGTPAASASETITVIVNEVNTPPVLALIPAKTVNEGSLLTFTASATDADLPAQTLVYSLDAGAPTGASIDPVTGVFTWTPTELQAPSTITVTVRVTDNGTPALSTFQNVIITAKEVNNAPVLATISDQTINEGSLLTFTASASDSDIPAQTLTFSLGLGTPVGATIHPLTGLFNWTPTELQGPSTNHVTIRVTDNGVPALSASQTITIVVNEVNSAPVLTRLLDKTINEGQLLTFGVIATDPDRPVQSLTYSLDAGAPAGASINPVTGLFTWTPAEEQGPNTYPVTFRVTDNGVPPLSASQTILITVNEVNRAPVLAPIGNKTIGEGSLLSFTVSATDPDVPVQALTYSLATGAPAGASIDPFTGVFSWTPTEAQGPRPYAVTFRVTDNGSPALSSVQTIIITVSEVNTPPVLAPIGDKTVDERTLLTFKVSATDADLPAQILTFSLGAGAPAGAAINPVTGVFTWTPTEAQGPSTNRVTIRVTDTGPQAASAAETITIIVNEVNTAPVLALIPNKTTSEQSQLTFTVIATDADLPAQTLTYSLDPGAPEGAEIDPFTGVFTWTPTEGQGPSTITLTIRVTDDGTPALTAFQNVTITVKEANTAPVLAPIADVTVAKSGFVTFDAFATDSDVPAQVLTYSLGAGAPLGAVIEPATGLFTWLLPATQKTGTNVITVRVTDNGFPSMSATQRLAVIVVETNRPAATLAQSQGTNSAGAGNVAVVGNPSSLEALPSANSRPLLVIHGQPGTSYVIESTSDEGASRVWTPVWQGTLTNSSQTIQLSVSATNRLTLFRAIQQ